MPPRTACVAAARDGTRWLATLQDDAGAQTRVEARALVNATGPWAHAVLAEVPREQLVSQMVGREINDIYHYRPRPLGQTRLEVKALAGEPW